MNAQDYWNMFLETGAPEMYLLFNKARRMEGNHVSEDQGIGSKGFQLQ